MAYEVVKAFHDLQDYKDIKGGKVYHHYDVGDTLRSSGNAQGVPLIAEVKEKANAGKA